MNEENKMKIKDILEWVYCIVIAVVLALIVRYFIGTPTIVQQPSMWPTLKEGQRLILNRTIRLTKAIPNRGDIVTFEAPSKVYVSATDANLNNPVFLCRVDVGITPHTPLRNRTCGFPASGSLQS